MEGAPYPPECRGTPRFLAGTRATDVLKDTCPWGKAKLACVQSPRSCRQRWGDCHGDILNGLPTSLSTISWSLPCVCTDVVL